ncbi:NmrA family NAD(P)-binding protein [Streptomyces oryzae]|uniref:NmrA family NAD(P)-binding protein n=1 Tax=Streptomyces oryzae TaxID=1434886 RepID=A0ABS3XFZ8_9ACTN|nr:NAD(P)H-binding protein [Streptomyces oryzae]MBO8194323.1 NmrA family NAD(P)-binding protein [Streptomyces oryzae]
MILVTGATGKVGGQVAAQLVAAGVPVRVLVRDPRTAALPEAVEAARGELVDVVRGDLTNPASLTEALTGEVERAFLMWPLDGPHGAAEVVTALAAGVRRIVYLSTRGVPDDDSAPLGEDILGTHAALERRVRGSGVEWTLLRPGGFAGNTLGWAPQVRAGGPVRLAHPQAARTLVHEADVATAAVRALLTDELVGAAPELTGPELLTQAEQVAVIGEVVGRPLTVEKLSREEARADFLAAGLPPAYVEGILDAHAAMETDPETVAPGSSELLGRPALTYRQWVTDHLADFR